MPVYAYTCSTCGAELEVRASVAEKTAGLSPASRPTATGRSGCGSPTSPMTVPSGS